MKRISDEEIESVRKASWRMAPEDENRSLANAQLSADIKAVRELVKGMGSPVDPVLAEGYEYFRHAILAQLSPEQEGM